MARMRRRYQSERKRSRTTDIGMSRPKMADCATLIRNSLAEGFGHQTDTCSSAALNFSNDLETAFVFLRAAPVSLIVFAIAMLSYS